MMKDIAWNLFKSTGNINTFLELKQIEKVQSDNLNIQKVDTNGNSKNKGNNNCGK